MSSYDDDVMIMMMAVMTMMMMMNNMTGNNLDVTDDCYYREGGRGDAGQTWKQGPRAEVGGGCLIMWSLSDNPHAYLQHTCMHTQE